MRVLVKSASPKVARICSCVSREILVLLIEKCDDHAEHLPTFPIGAETNYARKSRAGDRRSLLIREIGGLNGDEQMRRAADQGVDG